MNKNEIKKALYKQNPKAVFKLVQGGIAHYDTSIVVDQSILPEKKMVVSFRIPVSDMGDASFYPYMEAKLLIRWIAE